MIFQFRKIQYKTRLNIVFKLLLGIHRPLVYRLCVLLQMRQRPIRQASVTSQDISYIIVLHTTRTEPKCDRIFSKICVIMYSYSNYICQHTISSPSYTVDTRGVTIQQKPYCNILPFCWSVLQYIAIRIAV
jgi:hypothetical protein